MWSWSNHSCGTSLAPTAEPNPPDLCMTLELSGEDGRSSLECHHPLPPALSVKFHMKQRPSLAKLVLHGWELSWTISLCAAPQKNKIGLARTQHDEGQHIPHLRNYQSWKFWQPLPRPRGITRIDYNAESTYIVQTSTAGGKATVQRA